MHELHHAAAFKAAQQLPGWIDLEITANILLSVHSQNWKN